MAFALRIDARSRAIAADEMHSRPDVSMFTATLVDQQLGLIAADPLPRRA